MTKPKTALTAPPETILVGVTRQSQRCQTLVYIHPSHGSRILWLEFGEAQLRKARDRYDGRWLLQAYLPGGVTDMEHSSCYAIRLPLIGLEFVGTDYHASDFRAWVDPNEGELGWSDFHVPRPGYNPMKDPDTYTCTDCHADPHPIVKQYLAPFDAELYSLVRGKQVDITLASIQVDDD